MSILFCAMAPSLLAFNVCRHHIIRRSQPITFRRVFVSLLYEPTLSYQYTHLKLPHSSSALLSSNSYIETQSISPAVRSIRPTTSTTGGKLQLLSFYRFIPISEPEVVRDILFEKLKTISGLRGTVYVAKEGINAQFAVPEDSLHELLQSFGKSGNTDGACLPFDAFEKEPPNIGNVVDETVPTFDRLIVRTRDYILRDGISSTNDGKSMPLDWTDNGVELDAKDWDAQLRPRISEANDKVQLLDCRNTYESDQGTFVESIPLNTQTFSETWSLLDEKVESNTLDPSKPVYIFCTGGIRCVKVGAYLKQRLGFEDVRSLKHGIIGYERWKNGEGQSSGEKLERGDANANNSLWAGENFLFDKRRFAKGNDSSGK